MSKRFIYYSKLREINNRRKEPYTQQEIADLIKQSRQAVNRWMSREAFIDPDMVIAGKLAAVFDLDDPMMLFEAEEIEVEDAA